ncbi:MAG TPA: HNH endonuclease [Telluria sp.]|jgi:hypothetical protein
MDIEKIKPRLSYDPITGAFTWIKPRAGIRVGAHAGHVSQEGYVHLGIAGKTIKAHRLAWLLTHGGLPEIIDHINGNRADNRIANLRAVTASQNRMNAAPRSDSKSRTKGVSWAAREGKWNAQIHVDGKKKFLGYFVEFEAAKVAYEKASKQYHGEFARAG